MPFAKVGALDVCYEVRGSGPRLLIITGTGRDLRRKPSVFDYPVARHFELLSYDQRGLGRTSKPEHDYSMADYADDAAGLLDALGWQRCLVMGISFGGMVAQEFALRHPGRAERLVFACSSSGGAGGASYPLHEFEALPPEEAARGHVQVSDLRRDAAWQKANPEEFRKLLDERMNNVRINEDEPGAAMGSHRQLEARKGHDTWDRLATIEVPVYICGGLYDGIAPPDNLRAMHRRIPGSKLDLFEGGHQFYQQDARAWPSIMEFLQGR